MQTPEEIDKLTLELLINKSQYKKYLLQTNPTKFKEHREHLEKISKYRGKIRALFSDLLENPEKQITNQINEDFSHFVKTCIYYFEMKEIDDPESMKYPKDEDVLFENCEENQMSENERETDELILKPDTKALASSSFWGKSIVKKNAEMIPNYTLDMFLKNPKKKS